MKIVKTSKELVELLSNRDKPKPRIGFVPTMGALHKGHISLLQTAVKENDLVICSIFVNPTQFNDPKDLEKYPRPIEQDIQLLEDAGCDLLFLPDVNDIYGENTTWNHSFGQLENIWEGEMRPGHFKGVGQIVYKFFTLVKPDNVYFGQKDFQQTLIIKQLIKDFKLGIHLHICPIIREDNGLAMSSRNVRLSELHRLESGKIFKALTRTREAIEKKVFNIAQLKKEAIEIISEIPDSVIEYLEIVDPENLSILEKIEENSKHLMIVAVKVGNTRLIDNMYV